MAYVRESTKSLIPAMVVLGFFTALAVIITIFEGVLPIVENYNLEQLQCNVSQVDYPTSLPTVDDTSNWISCDCGRSCNSWSPCIKIYTNNDNSSFILEDIYSNSNIPCTYSDIYCPRSEDIVVLQEELRLAIARAESYINETIPCYYNDYTGEYFISDYLDEPSIYFYFIITGILTLLMSIVSITYCVYKRRDRLHSINIKNDGSLNA